MALRLYYTCVQAERKGSDGAVLVRPSSVINFFIFLSFHFPGAGATPVPGNLLSGSQCGYEYKAVSKG